VLNEFLANRLHVPVARVAYWQQLRSSEPSLECFSLILGHLWLSCLLANPAHNTLLLDPLLFKALVTNYMEDPSDLEERTEAELWGRQQLWTCMAPSAHILALAEPTGVLIQGKADWVLYDIQVQKGRLTHMDILTSPSRAFNSDAFNAMTAALISSLNRILPKPGLLERSSKVEQRFQSIAFPQQQTHESVGLVMLAHICGKLLAQDVGAVNVSAFRQAVCSYYDKALRPREVDLSFPWPGLTTNDGRLQCDDIDEAVTRQRFSLAANREPLSFEMFPRRRSYIASVVTPGPSAPFFQELSQAASSHGEDILVGTSGRSLEHLEKATLLGQYPSWPEEFRDERLQVPEALSLDEFVDRIHSIGGPESLDAGDMLLTGSREGRPVKLDWLKDSACLQKEWVMASMDVDSLSLTTREAPEFLEAGNLYPYPSRAQTLTNRNELRVELSGKEIDMHTCKCITCMQAKRKVTLLDLACTGPNFCIMSLGSNNQFRLMVFLPGCRNMVNDRMWRNIPREQEMEDWYMAFLTALQIASADAPDEWQHAFEKTIEALPSSYRAAAVHATTGGGGRSFVGHRIEPQILNAVFPVLRHIIDARPEFACYRGYFFHLCGINLKLATQNIHGREPDNPLNYAFRIYGFINWYEQNPNNIVVDVGLALNLHRASLPEELRKSTLLIRHDPLRELLRPGFKQPQQDRYCHSFVISGLRAQPLSKIRSEAGVLKIQAYHKDMVLTYRHRDKSIGANFTVDEALGLGNRRKFLMEMKGFQSVIQEAGSYGVRFEWRLSAWAANKMMMFDSRDMLDHLFDSGVVVSASS
jgi:hypothetical protein